MERTTANTRATMRKFAIAGLQVDLGNHDNLQTIAAEVRTTKLRYPWVHMMVLGELSAHGFDMKSAEPVGGPTEQAFCRMARESKVWFVPGSFWQKEGDKIFNASVVIDPQGNVVSRYRKIFPFRPYEEGVTPGDSICVFSVPNVGKFGLSICYDIWFPELSRAMVWMGAEVIINTSVTNTIDRDVELSIARATAATNQCYLVNLNGAGTIGRGRSIVCGPGGEVIHQASATNELYVVELDLDYVVSVRREGWHGLAQALKTFRDNTVDFAPYVKGSASDAFKALGPLVGKSA